MRLIKKAKESGVPLRMTFYLVFVFILAVTISLIFMSYRTTQSYPAQHSRIIPLHKRQKCISTCRRRRRA